MKFLASLASLALALQGGAAFAQDAAIADIEALIDSAATPQIALVAAAEQARSGDISGSATALERALINAPDSVELRAAYVATLCDLDDMQAAQFEMGKLANAEIPAESKAGIEASCGPIGNPVL